MEKQSESPEYFRIESGVASPTFVPQVYWLMVINQNHIINQSNSNSIRW